MKYEMIYFDLDNTILDFDKSEEYALKSVFEYLNIRYDESYIEIYRPINEKWWKLFSEGKYKKEVIVVERFREFFEKIGVFNLNFNEVAKVYLKGLSSVAFFIEGAEEFLGKLKEKGFRMAAITNGVESVQQKRAKIAKLDRFFEFVLTSEKVGKPKPEPDIFFYAEKLSNVPLSRSIYIGDNIETDYEGAKKAKLDFILFDPKNKFGNNIKKVENYKELYRALVD
jgi:putative hydrolase of the HAD superfamily